jgi:hypothetical protein
LRIISLSWSEKRLERVISWNNESGEICQELASEVEKHEEEVKTDDSEEAIDLWNGCLLLEVVEKRILRELSHKKLIFSIPGQHSRLK